jgi:Uma2 family endonuclease
MTGLDDSTHPTTLTGEGVILMAAADILTRTRHLVPEDRVCFRGTWELFELLERTLAEQHVRVAFDGERIELMSPSQDHDDLRLQAALVVRAVCGGLGVALRGCGSTTRKQPPDRGIEPDESFYLAAEKREAAAARRRGRKPAPSAPPGPIPDLAFEVDLSPSALDRPAIYAALGVPEIWRYDGERVRIERLTPEGVYETVSESGWLAVRPEELERFLTEEYIDDNEFMDHVKAWARDVLLPRREARRA